MVWAWFQTGADIITALSLIGCILWAVQRRLHKHWRYDFLNSNPVQWALMLAAVAGVASGLDWHDEGVRNAGIGYAAFCVVIFAMLGYGRLVVLPRLERKGPRKRRATAFMPVARGPFRGWNPAAVRRTRMYLLVFIVAGVCAGLLVEQGQFIFGAIAAAIALFATPVVVATALAIATRSPLRDTGETSAARF